MTIKRCLMLVTAAGVLQIAAPAVADSDLFVLTIKDHRFQPEVIEVPAGQKVKLLVRNLDATPEEFDSHDLNREKVIPGGQEAIIFIGPLRPGAYRFEGEFHAGTAQGKVLAK